MLHRYHVVPALAQDELFIALLGAGATLGRAVCRHAGPHPGLPHTVCTQLVQRLRPTLCPLPGCGAHVAAGHEVSHRETHCPGPSFAAARAVLEHFTLPAELIDHAFSYVGTCATWRVQHRRGTVPPPVVYSHMN